MTDDLFDDEVEETTPERSNADQAQARLDREKAKLKKELDELKAWRAEREQADKKAEIRTVFEKAELNQKWAEFYQGEDTSPEAVRAWAISNEFIKVDEEDAEPDHPRGPERAHSHGFTPTVIEGDATPTGKKMYSRAEMEEIARENPTRARALAEAGRVKWNNPQISER